MSFHTLIYSSEVSRQVACGIVIPDPRPQIRLITRPVNYNFTVQDYQAYEDSRDYLLRCNPHVGRAALMAGGITWRLAIESLMPGIVLDGPDDIALVRGVGFRLQDRTNNVYVDDNLSHDEVRIIVGMYVRSPQRDRFNTDHTSFPMWWPDPATFKNSALDYGSWSPVNENWYRILRDKYRQGAAQPKTGVQWRTMVRNWDKRSRKLSETSCNAAMDFLRYMSA